MNIIRHKYIFLTISGLLVAASIVAFGLWGLRPGIDFTGGSLMEVEFSVTAPTPEKVQNAFSQLHVRDVLIQPTGERGMLIRFPHVDEAAHQQIVAGLSSLVGTPTGEASPHPLITEKRFDTIGPTIGAELKQRAILAVILAILAIILYVAVAFRKVSRPVASWKYGIATLVALIHDVAIPVGAFAALGHFRGIEVDPLFITALLTVLGFSVHDTIVVFDRIRENLYKLKSSEAFSMTVNRSINETLVRSLMTSLTVLLVLAAIFFLGGASTRYFALALIIGIIFGTYSSIFVASPILVIWSGRGLDRK